jgi:hypothetical protein
MPRYRNSKSSAVTALTLEEIERRFLLYHRSLDRSPHTLRNDRGLFAEARRWGKLASTADCTTGTLRAFSV